MTTAAISVPKPAPEPASDLDTDLMPAAGGGDYGLSCPVLVNIRPILEAVAGRLTEDEVDQWFAGLSGANEGRGFYLELTDTGELVINPMVNLDSAIAESESIIDLGIWARENGGRALGSRAIVRLPDGARCEPDLCWLSPAQVAELGPVRSESRRYPLPGVCCRDNVGIGPAGAVAAQDGTLCCQWGAAGVADRSLPAPGVYLPPRSAGGSAG